MSLMRGAARLAQGARSINSSAVKSAAKSEIVNPGYKTLKPTQSRFGSEDGTPVYLKGGTIDRLLYQVTMAACVAAVIWDFKLYYDLGTK